MQCVVLGYLRAPNKGREPWSLHVEAPSPAHAVLTAVETAHTKGRQFIVEEVVAHHKMLGFCRDCLEPVFQGGDGRSRRGELRCFECGGAK